MNSAPLRPVLQSLADWRELIVGCLNLFDAKSVVEIGAENGAFTAILGEWAMANGNHITTIEPEPSDDLLGIVNKYPAIKLVAGRSPDCLSDFAPADAYLIDGDHNYYTVLRELRAIVSMVAQGEKLPLVILHDVGWPWGRRDLYYAPTLLPPEAVRPNTFVGGVVPGNAGIVASGVVDAGGFAAATQEGGPKNGVRTAVEDFLRGQPRYRFIAIPMIFGLGILFDSGGPNAHEIESLVGNLDFHPVLQRVEDNRLELLWAEREHVKALGVAEVDLASLQEDAQRHLQETSEVQAQASQARAEIEKLQLQVALTHAEIEKLQRIIAERDTSIRQMVSSKSWRATSWLRSLGRSLS